MFTARYGLIPYIRHIIFGLCGPVSSVGIATELRVGRSGIEFRWRRDFPPVQTGPGAHPASCKIGTVAFPMVKRCRGVLLTTHPLLVQWSWKSRAITLPTLWATPGLYRYHFILYVWIYIFIFLSPHSSCTFLMLVCLTHTHIQTHFKHCLIFHNIHCWKVDYIIRVETPTWNQNLISRKNSNMITYLLNGAESFLGS